MLNIRFNTMLLASVAVTALGMPITALAQATSDSVAPDTAGPEEIIVTAQRRAENVQSIPIAIQAVGGAQLAQAGVKQISQLATLTPSFVFAQSGPEPTITLRGIGGELVQIAGEPSVSLSLDGVPLLRQQYFLGAFFDVDRVEVLRGPQGTISGRNATGGAVNIISRRPTWDTEGEITGTYGNYDTRNLTMYASGPIIADKLAAHFAVERRDQDGFVRSTINDQRYGGKDDILARASLLARPADGIELLLSGDYYNSEDNSPPYVSMGIGSPGVVAVIDPPGFGSVSYYDPDSLRAAIAGLGPNQRETFTARSHGVNFQTSFELGDVTTLKTVTGYRRLEGNQRYESVRSDTVIDPIYTPYNQRQFTQEISLTSSIGENIDWLLGGQYIDERANQSTSVIYFAGLAGPVFYPPLGFNLTVYDQIKLRSYAAFGQVQWRFLPKLQLTLGGRYTHDRKVYSGDLGVPAETPPIPGITINQRAVFSAFTPRAALDWKPNRDLLIYASASRGFKAGGFGTAGQLIPGFAPFKPETVWNYEAGIKTQLLDRLLTANLTGFWADYRNLQFPFFVAPATIIRNAGKARVRGIEFELGVYPARGFDLGFSATYLNAEYLDFLAADPSRPATSIFGTPVPGVDQGPVQSAGNSLPKAPKISLSANASYRFEFGTGQAIVLYGNAKYQSKIFFSPFENDYESQAGYTLVNLRATFEATENLSLSVFGRNVFDKNYFVGRVSQGSNLPGIDPRLPVVVGNPLGQVVASSTNIAVLGEPTMYGVTVGLKF